MTPRNLSDVIDEMISVIPKNKIHLILFFEDIKESQKVRAPEDMTGWWQISNELDKMLNKYNYSKILKLMLKPLEYIPEWKLNLISIFTTQPLDEIKKDIYG
jgi:hypothetical protein